MISVLLNWLYTGILCYIFGKSVSVLSEKYLNFKMKQIDNLLVCGLVILTVYSEFFSLFGPVGLTSNIILLIIASVALFFLIFYKKKLFEKQTVLWWIAVPLLTIIWSYLTSRGYMHYDSDLYHAQSIRWIEEYGVVKGLGNLHQRLAYNSSFFSLSALVSGKCFTGISLHTMSGFFALILSISCLDVLHVFRDMKFKLSDFARLAAVYYLFTIVDEVLSPASDYSTMIVIFYLIIKWADLSENEALDETGKMTGQSFLCVLGVYATTLKLTSCLIVLLTLIPAVTLIKKKEYKKIILFLSLGFLIIAPWMIRTVILSGWLIYPFPAIDLFNVDWKISKTTAIDDAACIKVWARGLYDSSLVNKPITFWYKNWFMSSLSSTEKCIILADYVSFALLIILSVISFIRKNKKIYSSLYAFGIVFVCFWYWQFSAPLPRYGYVYILLPVALTVGYFFTKIKKPHVLVFLLLLFMLYKIFAIGRIEIKSLALPYYIKQQDYGTYNTKILTVNNINFYYPTDGDQIGYDAFPGTLYLDFKLRGNSINDGFASGK